MMFEYTVIIEPSRTGYSAYIPDLPGCVAAATTAEETEELIRGALKTHLEGMLEDGDPIPEPLTIARRIRV